MTDLSQSPNSFNDHAIIIPVYEPPPALVGLVERVVAELVRPVVVVDDGSSTDCRNTFEEISDLSGVTLLQHQENRGKGAAMKTAFRHVLENLPEAQSVVTMDADGQHAVKDVGSVVLESIRHPEAMILGVRQFKEKVPLRSEFGNRLTRFIFRCFTGRSLQDTQTGLRAIPRSLLPRLLELEGDRYEYELDMLLAASSEKVELIEMPIETIYLDGNKSSHFRVFRDSFRVYWVFLRFVICSPIIAGVDMATFAGVFMLTEHILGSNAIGRERVHKLKIEDQEYSHAELDCRACGKVHRGDDPRFSPFWNGSEKDGESPSYNKFCQHRFRHLAVCVGRGCLRACLDHLEKTGRISKTFKTPLSEGRRWKLDAPPGESNIEH